MLTIALSSFATFLTSDPEGRYVEDQRRIIVDICDGGDNDDNESLLISTMIYDVREDEREEEERSISLGRPFAVTLQMILSTPYSFFVFSGPNPCRVLQMPILLLTKEALGQVRRLLAMNVGIKGKQEWYCPAPKYQNHENGWYWRHVECWHALGEEKPIQDHNDLEGDINA
ncbi:hypothetical protein Tco_0228691 [Tanacetum coccineum]